MATINFLYRSKKENAPLTARLLFSHNGKDYVRGCRTEIYIYSYEELLTNDKLSAKLYWEKLHTKRTNDIDISNKQVEVDAEINSLRNYIFKAYTESNIEDVIANRDWLHDVLGELYDPKPKITDKPLALIPFFDYYTQLRKDEISKNHLKTIGVTQNKLAAFQDFRGRELLVSGVNEDFKNEFVAFSRSKRYSQNTQQKDLKIVKSVCRYAKYVGLEVHPQMEALRLPKEEVDNIYLSLDDLEEIKGADLKQEYLDNARDWLLTSCYLGQRVSDLMRFSKEMIRKEGNKYLLEFQQVKTKKQMVIPVPKEVRKILAKRNGEFPRAISDQKYNEFIKVVCREAGLNEMCLGKKRVCIAPKGAKPKKNDYRDVTGEFEKWELVSSHIGRRSFASNNYGKIPTAILITITGHSSEQQFLSYIKKSNKDIIIEAYKYFD